MIRVFNNPQFGAVRTETDESRINEMEERVKNLSERKEIMDSYLALMNEQIQIQENTTH